VAAGDIFTFNRRTLPSETATPLSLTLETLTRALVKERPEPGLWLIEQWIPEIGPRQLD
jgi:hypothetical protein